MTDPTSCSWWYVRRSPSGGILIPRGPWKISNLKRILKFVSGPLAKIDQPLKIDGSELTELDTAGAMVLFELASPPSSDPAARVAYNLEFTSFKENHQHIIDLVRERWSAHTPVKPPKPFSQTEKIGEETFLIAKGMKDLVAFIGEAILAVIAIVLNPRRLRVRELVVQLELVCIDAIPIVCLVTLLIGVVVAYLFAMQLVKYGANIFVVDGVVLAMCRELSPIIVAITLAGRSGSAFTAQIGTMKINQEIDAMVTTGLSPMQVLVIPRIIALAIALPLLSFVGDIIGTLGGLMISTWYVGIGPYAYFDRIHSYFPYKSFYFGLMKTPFFAAFIAIIGCQMGLAVENNARSVGLNTTSTVVQSIVWVIILDALFAVLYSSAGFY